MSAFQFKYFTLTQDRAAMKVGTDAMLLGALIDVSGKYTGLDIGSGTGVLSLMVAQRNDQLNIDAIEIDEASFEEARDNFSNSPWSNCLNAINSNFLEFTAVKKYDLIFSNPPYYQNSLQNEDDRKAKTKHEVHLPIDALVEKVNSLLSPNGNFWVIVPSATALNWVKACEINDLFLNHSIEICGKVGGEVKRLVYCFGKESIERSASKLTVRTGQGGYTEEYIDLTKEYHAVKLKLD